MSINIKFVAVITAVLAIIGIIKHVSDLHSKVTELTTENMVLRDNAEVLERAITASNQAITEMSTSVASTSAKFDELNQTIKQQTIKLNSDLEGILRGPKPLTCEDAIAYLIKGASK